VLNFFELWTVTPPPDVAAAGLAILLLALLMALGIGPHLLVERQFWPPAQYLSQFPRIGIMRVWARYAVLVSFFVALLAGIGITRLEVHPGFRPVWKFLILALIVLDFIPGKLYSIESALATIPSVNKVTVIVYFATYEFIR